MSVYQLSNVTYRYMDIISFAKCCFAISKSMYIIRYTRDVTYEMFESECFILFKLGLFFTVEILGCFILTQIYSVITKTYIAIS
jgi:hypothetical protein